MKKNFLLLIGLFVGACGIIYLANRCFVSDFQSNVSTQQAGEVSADVSSAPERETFSQSGDISSAVAAVRESLEGGGVQLDDAFESILDSDPMRRVQGVRTLASAHSNKFLPLIMKLLERDKNAEVRAESASALENFESVPAASLALVAALTDSDPGVRENALLSLRMHRNDRVQSALYSQLQKGGCEESTRQAVAVFLTRYYPQLDPFDDLLKRASNL
jgi:HEAT repeat protein